jgi:Protein of unknown function (DUF3426)
MDDDAIPEDALEFNPAAADVNQVFVEAPPNPEWTAATGTFKALVLQSEVVAQNPAAPAAKPRAPEPPSTRITPSSRPDDEEEFELDADFLSSTAEMRRLQLDRSDSESGTHPAPGDTALSQAGASKAAPGPGDEQTYSFTEPPPRTRPHTSNDSPSRAQPHTQSDAPSRLQPNALGEPAPRGATHLASAEKPRPAQLEPPSQPRARSTSDTQSQPQLRVSQPSGEPTSPDTDIASRVPPRKTVRAFGLDTVDPPPEQLASLARSRIAPTSLELEPPSAISRLSRLLSSSPTVWTTGACVLVVLLLLQVLNHYRNDLAATPQFNKPITALYSAFGVHLTPRWDLHAYDVRQLGASVDAENAGQIMVRASVKNSGTQAQPMPLLRVTLQDRFGNRIAARDVAPANYLPAAIPPTALLSAGQRIDAEMAFVDPGANAVGFEIDACLPAPAGGIACANDPVSR